MQPVRGNDFVGQRAGVAGGVHRPLSAVRRGGASRWADSGKRGDERGLFAGIHQPETVRDIAARP